MVNGADRYEFQEDCVNYLFETTTSPTSKQCITIKAPTGAGKTVILIKYIDEFLNNTTGDTAFIWLCPGSGELEEQSQLRMEQLAPHIESRALILSIIKGFERGTVTFINWELVNKSGNNALKDGEKKNLYDRIEEAHRNGVHFIVIIDEEHKNADSTASRAIIDAFQADHIIRVSATPKKVAHQEYYEIPEAEVIDAGLITTAICVNEGVVDSERIEDDYDILLKLADDKRKEIGSAYEQIGVDIRPLVLIQFPVGHPETIAAVEKKLAAMGYTTDNHFVNVWLSGDHRTDEDLTDLNGRPAFLLMKQAVATGWDCPRAKILVKLRETGSRDFQIQTIGRIRRMPERKHYVFPGILDLCYIYTLDTKYKKAILTSWDRAYQPQELTLKPSASEFKLTKELRNNDTDSGISERELVHKVYDFFVKKYGLSTRTTENRVILEKNGYNFSPDIDSKILQGEFETIAALSTASSAHKIEVKTKINTHTHGIYLMRAVDEIKTITSIPAKRVKSILQRLFRKGKRARYKLISLNVSDFYAFLINNIHELKKVFREIMAEESEIQLSFVGQAKTTTFTIPPSESYNYSEKKAGTVYPMHKNAYDGYTSAFITADAGRSTSERMFEEYCESVDDIEWVYKNGDAGPQYFSIVYLDGLSNKQHLFYPDYIVKMKSGEIWIIETKGGWQRSGHTKNIDLQIKNKFIVLKEYTQRYGVNWGFVRDNDNDGHLYINNTTYTDDFSDDSWMPLESVIK